MILSVVIVSYNVKYFLEQCLSSLQKALNESLMLRSQTEVYIVDNASTDGTLDFLIPRYPSFHCIQNRENTGFAKANNQALQLCSGEFILFLNPDTLLAEDTLDVCISFMRKTADAGAVGLRMIDGAGNFLKESKRGFPSPQASFFKMSGLVRLFPRSKIFSAYYMGHLPETETHAVDILSGAFMMVRKNILDKTGGFDERFFMYAEDIDLSYRITQIGFRNYYLSDTTIVHFKGESTKKDIRYVRMFYGAMEKFMQKHFSGSFSSLQRMSLQVGMRFYETIALLRLPFQKGSVKPKKVPRIFIKGDFEMTMKWKQQLEKKKIQLAENESSSDKIIYCAGPHQSWKSIIAEIGKSTQSQCGYAFHGKGTHSAVSSSAGQGPEEIFEI